MHEPDTAPVRQRIDRDSALRVAAPCPSTNPSGSGEAGAAPSCAQPVPQAAARRSGSIRPGGAHQLFLPQFVRPRAAETRYITRAFLTKPSSRAAKG